MTVIFLTEGKEITTQLSIQNVETYIIVMLEKERKTHTTKYV
jgi:hypothetical protein